MTADFDLAADAALGYYSIELSGSGHTSGNGSFYVEEYKKPEYQVTVKPAAPRVLQGNSIQATIEARYFFGEPVASAKVKYVVHTSTHYWWDEDERTTATARMPTRWRDRTTRTTTLRRRPSSRSTRACSTPTAASRSHCPRAIDGKHNDQDYRIEARVTDAANREVAATPPCWPPTAPSA